MFWTTCKFFLVMTALTGCLYPFLVTEIAQFLMPRRSNGSLIEVNGEIRGSKLIAQQFKEEKYFWPRPSHTHYQSLHSGGSNLGPTSSKLKEISEERAKQLADIHHTTVEAVPMDLIYSSASGLDPDITPDTAYFQVDRIVRTRQLSPQDKERLLNLIYSTIKGRQGGFLGPYSVNVLLLNQLLDQNFPPPQHHGR
jgi:K+-transporting ATPase ATPase C chain